MSETKNITVPEINKTVEQMLIKGRWLDALDFWINNTDSLVLIRWLAQFISQLSPEEDSLLLQSIVRWKEGDDEQRWEIFRHAESVGFSTQTGALGVSLFVSQGRLSPAPYDPVYAPSCSEKKIIYGILMHQSNKYYDAPDEGVFFLFRHWCNSHS